MWVLLVWQRHQSFQIHKNTLYSISQEICTRFLFCCALLWFIHWLIFPYPSGLLHWHCGNLTIAPVPAKQPWWIWINTSFEFIMNDYITTTKQSTTKPCAYFLGYTVCVVNDTTWNSNLLSNLSIQISRTLVGNKTVEHSDAEGASPVGAASTTSSFSTQQLASMDWAKTTTKLDEKKVFGFGVTYIRGLAVASLKTWHSISRLRYPPLSLVHSLSLFPFPSHPHFLSLSEILIAPLCIYVNEKFYILIKISPKFVPKGPIDNKAGMGEAMAWRRTGVKPSPEPMLTQFTDAHMRPGEMSLHKYSLFAKCLWVHAERIAFIFILQVSRKQYDNTTVKPPI